MNHVKFSNFRTTGTPFVSVSLNGEFSIGHGFSMNNCLRGNPIGCSEKCCFVVSRNAKLEIGNNVGISQSAIVCTSGITIGDDVKIGGGCAIYDTDFHSLNPEVRKTTNDLNERKSKPVIIGNNVFIGAKSIILKGVTIGENSIIGAGSVVTKDIPSNQIWAGNPIRFIREILSNNN